MNDVVIIAAVAKNGVIGSGRDIPWRISEDWKRFKAVTEGHAVVMGRQTWESLPKRPLPGRRNIVLSRNPGFRPQGCVVVRSLADAFAQVAENEKIFIIGGAAVYAEAMEFATSLDLTLLERDFEGDVRFPEVREDQWVLAGREERTDPMVGAYSWRTYVRKK